MVTVLYISEAECLFVREVANLNKVFELRIVVPAQPVNREMMSRAADHLKRLITREAANDRWKFLTTLAFDPVN